MFAGNIKGCIWQEFVIFCSTRSIGNHVNSTIETDHRFYQSKTMFFAQLIDGAYTFSESYGIEYLS
jgi:hypothetical protein